jgi:hypothetical protein
MASGTRQGSSTTNGNDESMQTQWDSNVADNASIWFDLGRVTALGQLRISFVGGTTREYRVLVTSDRVTWETVADGTVPNAAGIQVMQHDLSGRSATFVRIIGRTRWRDDVPHSIVEIDLTAA